MKGFSGGVVALANQAIGIITERHKEEQQTLFIPLYLVKDWLKKLSRELGDKVLGKYFAAEQLSQGYVYVNR